MTLKRGRIRLYIEGDSKDLEAAAKRSDRAISDIEEAVSRYNKESGRMADSNDRVSSSNANLVHSTKSVGRETDSLDRRLQGVNIRFTALRNAVGLIKWPGMIAGAGYAAEGLGALSAGAVGLTAALAPLAGALVAYPALFGAFAQGAGVASLASFGVKDALSEMTQAHATAGTAAASSGKQQEAAAEGVRSAEEQLTAAQGTARRAQHELTLARKEAVEDLENLKNAATDAGFAEQRATMSLADARKELRKALDEPGTHTGSELADLELTVKEARQGVREAKLEKKRADEEASKAGRQGVGGSSKVVEAKRQLADSNRQVADSARALATASKSQTEAMVGSGAAAAGLESKLNSLPPAAQKFTRFLFGLQPKVKALQSTAAAGLFPGVEEGIKSALPLMPRLNKAIGETSHVMAGTAKQAGALIGSKGFGKDFSTVTKGNTVLISRMGSSGLNLVDALRQVLVVGQPLVMWMAKSGEGFTDWIDKSAKAGRETGTLADFFDKTRNTMQLVGSILKSTATGFLEIGKAAYPLGHSILTSLNGQAEDFAHWTQSLTGRNELREYFREAKPGIFEFGRLIKDTGGALLSLSKNEGFFVLTHEVRTQLLPVMQHLLETTTQSFGPHLVAGLVQLGTLMGSLGGTSGPLVLFVDSVTRLLKAGNWMIDNVPGFKELAITLGGIAAVSKAMKFVGMATGLTNAIGLAKQLAVRIGLIEAGTAVSGSGAASGVLGGVLGGKGKVRVFGPGSAGGAAGEFGEKALVRDALGIGGGAAGATLGATAAVVAAPAAIAAIGIDKIATHTGHEMGNKITNALSQVIGEETAPQIEKALAGKNLGKLEAVRKHIHQALQWAIERGTDDANLKPLREQLDSVTGQIGGVTSSRDAFRHNLGDIRADVVTGLGGINADLRKGLAQADQGWVTGTRPWRSRTAEAMRAAVGAIRFGISDGQISVKKGSKEIARLLEQIHIVRGDDPFGLARAATDTFKKTNGITADGVREWTQTLRGMPKSAREAALDANRGMLQAWAQGHPKLEKQIQALTDFERRKFGATNQQLQQSTANTMTHMAESAEHGANSFAAALGGIGSNLTSALTALGVTNIPEFRLQLQQAGRTGTGVGPDKHHPEFARGGLLGGSGRHDTVDVKAAPGEAFLTRHQQPEVQTALGFAKTFGVVRSGSLGEVFANNQMPHWMAKGGIPKPILTGGGPAEREGEQHGINMVWRAAQKYYERHNGIGRVIANGNRMDALGKPYLWGGGHGPTASRNGAWDCSGGTSELADGSGLKGPDFNFPPMVSGGFTSWGKPGKGDFSVLANSEHVYSVLKTPKGWRAIGTSEENPGGGFGWIDGYTFRPGFTVRHADFGATTGSRFGKRDSKGQQQKKGFSRGGVVGTVASYLRNKGLNQIGTAGVLGNAGRESLMNPASEGTGGGGLWGFTTSPISLADLKAEAARRGVPWDDAKFQTDFMWNGPVPAAPLAGMLNSASTPQEAARLFMENWEHPGVLATGERESKAAKFYDAISGIFGGKGAAGKKKGVAKKGGKPKTKSFPAGHTGAGGGTYGSPAGKVTKPPHETETVLAGLGRSPLPAAAAGLPAEIRAMLSAPGLNFAQRLSIGELASSVAGGTRQKAYNAAGEETSADTHADDIAAAQYQKSLVQGQKAAVEKRLKEIAKKLREPQTTKKRNTLLAEQGQLLTKLAGDTTSLQSLNETINTAPDEPEGEESESQQQIVARLEELVALAKQDAEEKQRMINVLQAQGGPNGAIMQAIVAVVSGSIGGKVGLGWDTPSAPGLVASY